MYRDGEQSDKASFSGRADGGTPSDRAGARALPQGRTAGG